MLCAMGSDLESAQKPDNAAAFAFMNLVGMRQVDICPAMAERRLWQGLLRTEIFGDSIG